jgi:hypothetical protein
LSFLPTSKGVIDTYKLPLYTRPFQEETFYWRPGLGFSRWVLAIVRRMSALKSTDPKLHQGPRLEKSTHLEEPGQGSVAIRVIAATNWKTVPAPHLRACHFGAARLKRVTIPT